LEQLLFHAIRREFVDVEQALLLVVLQYYITFFSDLEILAH